MADKQTIPRRSDIDLLLFDFDGVMTDNHVYVFSDGAEAVRCTRSDGLGIDMLRAADLPMLIISTEKNDVVSARASKLQIEVYHGVADKASLVRDLIRDRNLDKTRVAFVGNDINDLGAMFEVGWRICPADSHPCVLKICEWVVPVTGGNGVVRHLAEALLLER
jgi:3-deoxy-D-manno-octulosonate 8-phosphate phosphatase (KDO 8-P phosphatase)